MANSYVSFLNRTPHARTHTHTCVAGALYRPYLINENVFNVAGGARSLSDAESTHERGPWSSILSTSHAHASFVPSHNHLRAPDVQSTCKY